jgi:hypothetical protein
LRLHDEDFLVVPRADAQNHDDGPRQSSGRRTGSVGKTNKVVDGRDTLDDRGTWFSEAGEDATKAEEATDLRKMAADTPPYAHS